MRSIVLFVAFMLSMAFASTLNAHTVHHPLHHAAARHAHVRKAVHHIAATHHTTRHAPPVDRVALQRGCMARAIWAEARGEGHKGMAAVGYVVDNRAKTRARNDYCSVVYQSLVTKKGKRLYQFTWAGKPLHIRSTDKAWADSLDIAGRVMAGTIPNPVGDATCFHVNKIRLRRDCGRYHIVIGHQTYASVTPIRSRWY